MLKTNSAKYHPEFDLERAAQEFGPLLRTRRLSGEMITSPFAVYSVEQLRDQLKLRRGKAIPADLFVYCLGEPPKPDCTKVGGQPYWIGDRAWPIDSTRQPWRFLAQFNFVDSKDLVGRLPGDVLLLFAKEKGSWGENDLHFEWLPGGKPQVPITDNNLLLYPAQTFHGAIFRTADYPDARGLLDRIQVGQPWNLPILNGTKIGGYPHFIHSDHDLDPQPAQRIRSPFNPREMITISARPSRHGYLCQLGSIQPNLTVAFPWCNHPKPVEAARNMTDSILFADMGTIYLYREPDGRLWNDFETY